jgi:hypothetical protein
MHKKDTFFIFHNQQDNILENCVYALNPAFLPMQSYLAQKQKNIIKYICISYKKPKEKQYEKNHQTFICISRYRHRFWLHTKQRMPTP